MEPVCLGGISTQQPVIVIFLKISRNNLAGQIVERLRVKMLNWLMGKSRGRQADMFRTMLSGIIRNKSKETWPHKYLLPDCGQCSKFKYMDINCKLAVITGGAGGIGYATADELLKQNLYRVILMDCCCEDGQKAVKELNSKHGTESNKKACYLQMDVRKQQDFEEALEEITKKFGGIDILINNHGYMNDRNWNDEIDINVKATIRGTLLGMKYLSQKKTPGDSLIVNVASTLCLDAEPPYLPIFSATQHAIGGLTKSLGSTLHFKNSGVRVVGMCPGPTSTNLLVCDRDKALVPEWSKYTDMVMLDSMQKPQSVAKGIVYMVLYAPPGSLWVVEDGQLFKTSLPGVRDYRERVLYV